MHATMRRKRSEIAGLIEFLKKKKKKINSPLWLHIYARCRRLETHESIVDAAWKRLHTYTHTHIHSRMIWFSRGFRFGDLWHAEASPKQSRRVFCTLENNPASYVVYVYMCACFRYTCTCGLFEAWVWETGSSRVRLLLLLLCIDLSLSLSARVYLLSLGLFAVRIHTPAHDASFSFVYIPIRDCVSVRFAKWSEYICSFGGP